MQKKKAGRLEGRISKIGNFAISSSVTDTHQQPCITCTTFNILAPIYKRLNHQDPACRESDHKAYWMTRNQKILNWLLYERSSIICLQEFWFGNQDFVNMYEKRLGQAGYVCFKLRRTNNRGDGLLTAVRKDYFRVISHQGVHFNVGDRVAQLLHVELTAPVSQHQQNDIRQEILIVNTHLQFPHDSTLCILRLQQVYQILQYVKSYQQENMLNPMPIFLCGDWNGSKRGQVYQFLRSQGFVSSYDTAHQYTDGDAQKWVSHKNHRGNICGVDFIWLLNPNGYGKLPKASWSEAAFGMFKHILRKRLLTEEDAFAFLKADNNGDYIAYSSFVAALQQLHLTGHPHGLSTSQKKALWIQADVDEDGVLDFKEFQQQIWNARFSERRDNEEMDDEVEDGIVKSRKKQTIGFSVKSGVLFPPEVEKGRWPEDYLLSDHARLTVVFSPIWMPCSQLIS